VTGPHDDHEHTLSPECWCAPIVLHIPVRQGIAFVHDMRDADRLAALGITDVVVSPDVPPQRGS
jgi:hypothetical protein